MKIILNNKPEIIDKETITVQELLELKNFTFKMRVIKINGQLIKKDEYATAQITDGDKVNVLYLMSGG